MKAPTLLVKKLLPMLSLLKVGQTSRSRSLGPKWKGLVTSNVHKKYESPNSSGKEAMSKAKVF